MQSIDQLWAGAEGPFVQLHMILSLQWLWSFHSVGFYQFQFIDLMARESLFFAEEGY